MLGSPWEVLGLLLYEITGSRERTCWELASEHCSRTCIFLKEIKILASGLEEAFIGWINCLEFQEK